MPFLCQQWLAFWGPLRSQQDIITSVNLTWTHQIRFAYHWRYLGTRLFSTSRVECALAPACSTQRLDESYNSNSSPSAATYFVTLQNFSAILGMSN